MVSAFKEKVYSLAKQIPKGKVATYGQLALLAGSPNASRAVGMCMRTNPDLTTIPCHRVVGSDGKLHGYLGPDGTPKKKAMLLNEGVAFIGDRVDLSQSKWIPDIVKTLL